MAQQKAVILSSGKTKQIAAGDTLLPDNLATGTRDGTKFLRDDGTWQAASGGIADGDKTDIVVSGSGSIWTLADKLRFDDSMDMYSELGSAIIAEPVWGTIFNVTTVGSLTSQLMKFTAVRIRKPRTVTGVKWFQTTAGVYTANNYNGVGLCSISAGTLSLVASSTDDGTIWKAANNSLASKAFSSTYVAAAGLYYIVILYCSSAQTTAPAIGAGASINNSTLIALDFANSAKANGSISAQTTLGTVGVTTFPMTSVVSSQVPQYFVLY